MRRILLLTSVLPWPLRINGGAQRTELLRRALSKYGQVDIVGIGGAELRDAATTDQQLAAANVLACFQSGEEGTKHSSFLRGRLGGMVKLLTQMGNRYSPNPQLVNWINQSHRSRPYSLIVSRYLAPALQAGIDKIKDVPLVLDLDDLDWQTLASSLKTNPWPGLNGKIGSFLVLKQVKRICKRSLGLFRYIWVTNQQDRELVDHQRCSVLPNIPFTVSPGFPMAPLPPASKSTELLFVGDLQFPPNREGINRFLTKIWPRVQASVPDATITIVGRGLSEQDRDRWSSVAGTNVVGFAADLPDYYARCAFTIVPVHFGGGTKIKILESLLFGRTVVSTEESLRGLAALLGNSPCVAAARTDDEFVQSCINLLRQPARRNVLAERGHYVVDQEFSFEHFSQIVDETVASVL